MYLKFALKDHCYYYVSLHEGRGKMKCLSCGKEEFETKNIRFTPEVKGEEVEVVVPCICLCTLSCAL